MAFSEKQREYLQLATHRWNIKSGATRSGKTYLDYFVIPKRLKAVRGSDGLILLLGNTKGTLQRNIIEPLQSIYGAKFVSDIKADNTAMLFGEKCYCLGADKVNQVDRIRGASIKYCYGDEVVTWAEPVFTMLKSRLDKPYSRFDGTCNPDSPNHWFYEFLQSASEKEIDLYLQDYCIDDNPFLDDNFKQNLKHEYAGTIFYDRYILGKWTLAEGLIYQMFTDERYVVNDIPENALRNGLWYLSIDYGTLNPCSMGLWCIYDGTAYRVREYYYSGRDKGALKTDEEYYTELERLVGDTYIQCIVVDPSAASFKETIRRHGKFRVRDAKNDVLDGIRCTARFLGFDKIKIHSSCQNIIREFKAYRWDNTTACDKPVKENDHAMDDMRYFCYTILNRL